MIPGRPLIVERIHLAAASQAVPAGGTRYLTVPAAESTDVAARHGEHALPQLVRPVAQRSDESSSSSTAIT